MDVRSWPPWMLLPLSAVPWAIPRKGEVSAKGVVSRSCQTVNATASAPSTCPGSLCFVDRCVPRLSGVHAPLPSGVTRAALLRPPRLSSALLPTGLRDPQFLGDSVPNGSVPFFPGLSSGCSGGRASLVPLSARRGPSGKVLSGGHGPGSPYVARYGPVSG